MSGVSLGTSTSSLRKRGALANYGERFPNMTPMVDIVMVILIFFMSATAFVGDELLLGARLEREATADEQAGDPMELPPVRIEVRLTTNAERRTIATGLGFENVLGVEPVVAKLREFTRGTAVDQIVLAVRAADGVPYTDVVRLHEAAEAFGIERVGIVLE